MGGGNELVGGDRFEEEGRPFRGGGGDRFELPSLSHTATTMSASSCVEVVVRRVERMLQQSTSRACERIHSSRSVWEVSFAAGQRCPATGQEVRMLTVSDLEHLHQDVFSLTLKAILALCGTYRIAVVRIHATKCLYVYDHLLHNFHAQLFVSPHSPCFVHLYLAPRAYLSTPAVQAVNLATNGTLTRVVLAKAATAPHAFAPLDEFFLTMAAQQWLCTHLELFLIWMTSLA